MRAYYAWLRALNKLDLVPALMEHTIVINAISEGEAQGAGRMESGLTRRKEIGGFVEEVTCELNSNNKLRVFQQPNGTACATD